MAEEAGTAWTKRSGVRHFLLSFHNNNITTDLGIGHWGQFWQGRHIILINGQAQACQLVRRCILLNNTKTLALIPCRPSWGQRMMGSESY